MKRLNSFLACAAFTVALPLFFFACSGDSDTDSVYTPPVRSSSSGGVATGGSSDSGYTGTSSDSGYTDTSSDSGDTDTSSDSEAGTTSSSSVGTGEPIEPGVSSAAEEPSSSSEEVIIIPKPTITCEFQEGTFYVVNEPIYAPTITCSDNSTFTATAFAAATSGIAAQDVNNWKTGGAAYYSTAGKSIYGVAGTCGEEEVDGSCPQLTITTGPAATCVFNPHSWEVGKPVDAPTIGCSGGAIRGGTPVLSKVSGEAATDFANWAIGGTATYSTTGSSKYQVSGVKCNDIPVDPADCNTLTITAPTITCGWSSSVVGGKEVSAPTITCDNGNGNAGGTFTLNETTVTFPLTTAIETTNSKTINYKVSGVTCGGYAAAEATCALTVTKSPTASCLFTNASVPAGTAAAAPVATCSDNKKTGTETYELASGTAVADLSTWKTTAVGTGTYRVNGVKCDGIAVTAPTCNLTTTAQTATCSGFGGTYIMGQTVTQPTIGCDRAGAAYTAGTISTSGTALFNASTWEATATGTSTYKVSGIKCDGITVADANCGSITVNPIPTASCTWATKTYDIGANVGAPTITCVGTGAGAVDKSGASFATTGLAANAAANWLNTSGTTTTYYTTSGTSNYTLSGIKCGTYPVAPANCDALTINPVTCSVSGGPYDIGETITATLTNCAGKTTSTTSLPTAGPGQSVTLASVTCGGNNVAVTNTTCSGTVNINKEPTCDAYIGVNGKTWNDICGGVAWKDVKWNTVPTVVNQRINGGNPSCYYLKDWTGTGNHGFQNVNNWKLNGETFSSDQQSPNGSNANDVKFKNAVGNKIDGGIYLYIPTHNTQPNISGGGANFVTGSLPYCNNGPAPTLTCALGTMTGAEGIAIDILPKLGCTDGTTPQAPISLGNINLSNPVATLGTLSNLQATATCGGTSGIAVSATCSGTLEVLDASQACEAQRDMSTYCPNTNWNDVYWNVAPRQPVQFGGVGNRIPAGCFWVQNWNTSFGNNFGSNNSVKFRVNGVEFTGDQQQPNNNNSNNTKLRNALNNKVDGGIYVWVESAGAATATSGGVTYKAYSAATNNFADGALVAGTSPAFCTNPNEALTCSGLLTITEGDANPFALSCYSASGAAPQSVAWSFGNWSSVTAGTHNVSATGTCDGKPVSASCGSLSVLAAGSMTDVNIGQGSGNGATLNAGTVYKATFTTGNGGAFRCPSTSAQNQAVGTYNGQTLYIIDGGNKILSLDNSSRLNPANGTVAIIAPSINLGSCYKDW